MKAPSEDELYDQMVRTETMGHAARGAAAGTLAGAAARAVGSRLGPGTGAVVGAAVGGLHGRNKGKANVLADKVKKEREQMKADARESKKQASDLTLLSGMHHIKESMDSEKLATAAAALGGLQTAGRWLGNAAHTVGRGLLSAGGAAANLVGRGGQYTGLVEKGIQSAGGARNLKRMVGGAGLGLAAAGTVGAGALGTGYLAGRASR